MTVRVDVVTLFPRAVSEYAATSILGRAAARGVWRLRLFDPRDTTDDVHRSVDDTPFGGGAGMVLRAEPLLKVLDTPDLARPVISLSPSGRVFTHDVARELAALSEFTLLCGRYEGVDQRVIDAAVDDEISLGDFVLAGGELAALCVIEAVVRLRPGGLGNDASPCDESFADGLLEYPHYTKPAEVRGRRVPDVLLSGDHAKVERWRRAQSITRTLERRPDLIERRGGLSAAERALILEFAPLEGGPASG